jgi:hypothetical protein
MHHRMHDRRYWRIVLQIWGIDYWKGRALGRQTTPFSPRFFSKIAHGRFPKVEMMIMPEAGDRQSRMEEKSELPDMSGKGFTPLRQDEEPRHGNLASPGGK